MSWLDQLAQEINIPFAPGGWYTVAEIAQKLDVDHQTVRRILKKRKAEAKTFRAECSDGRILRIPHYRL
jgi:IS30 family transposase